MFQSSKPRALEAKPTDKIKDINILSWVTNCRKFLLELHISCTWNQQNKTKQQNNNTQQNFIDKIILRLTSSQRLYAVRYRV